MMKYDFLKEKRLKKITASLILLAVFLCFSFLGRGSEIRYENGTQDSDTEVWEQTGASGAKDSRGTQNIQGAQGLAQQGQQEAQDSPSPQDVIFVDITGCVANPGVYQLPRGSRLFQAIELAGGLTEEADTRSVNRAKMLADEEIVAVLSKEEYERRQSLLQNGDGYADGKIDLNSASAEVLQRLSGVGPSTAQRILEYRSAHGAFAAIEELMNVDGIGEKTFAKLKEHICVR